MAPDPYRTSAAATLLPGEWHRPLLRWWRTNRLQLPWRETRDPYRVLVAEVLLQQTGHARVRPQYEALVEMAPTPSQLASLSPAVISTLIAPLGLHHRADTLVRLGRMLVDRYSGRVPTAERDLLSLPGVGPYAARAVRCFALGKPEPLVDKVTARVYSRMLGLQVALRPGRDPVLWSTVAAIQPTRPRAFHFAVIDLAAKVCRPSAPNCPRCPVRRFCREYSDA